MPAFPKTYQADANDLSAYPQIHQGDPNELPAYQQIYQADANYLITQKEEETISGEAITSVGRTGVIVTKDSKTVNDGIHCGAVIS